MEHSNLLSNDQLVFIFERFMWDNTVADMALEGEKEKLRSLLEKINGSNPIVREITTAITGDIVKSLEKRIEEFENATSEAGAKYKQVVDVVSTLSTAYYAITGKSKEDLAKEIRSNNDLRELVKEFMVSGKLY